jgi:hypothetical protein
MNKITRLLSLYLQLSAASAYATNLYVAPDGSNNNTGTEALPFATIAKAQSIAVPNGGSNTIFLKRGGVYREAFNGTALVNRRLAAYGTGAAPVWSGSVRITGWTAVMGRPGVFSANYSGTAPKHLYVNGTLMVPARFPNTGWLFTTADTGDNSIKDTVNLTQANDYWNGARAVWRKWTWYYETRNITDFNSATKTLTLGGSTSLPLSAQGTGYYIENKFEELDAPAEWFYNASTDKLYLYAPANTTLSTSNVEASVLTTGPSLGVGSGANGITFKHFTVRGLDVLEPATVENCTFERIGEQGLRLAFNSSPSTVKNCTFIRLFDKGVTVNQNPNADGGTIIEQNSFSRIGLWPNYIGNGTQPGVAVYCPNFKAPLIRLNTFSDIGGNGVNIDATAYNYSATAQPASTGATVRRNIFRKCMAITNDGAAIRIVGDHNTVEENIIFDTVGDMVVSQPWTPLGHGIWTEFIGRTPPGQPKIPFTNNKLLNNTIYGCNGQGIFCTENRNATITENVAVSNRNAGLFVSANAAYSASTGHTIRGNVLANGARPWTAPAGQSPQRLASFADSYAVPLAYGVPQRADKTLINVDLATLCDGCRLVRASGDRYIRRIPAGRAAINGTVATWQADEPDWADAAPLTVAEETFLFINDTTTNGTLNLPAGITWKRLNGSAISGTVSVDAYRSVLLQATAGATGSLAPYFLKSAQ